MSAGFSDVLPGELVSVVTRTFGRSPGIVVAVRTHFDGRAPDVLVLVLGTLSWTPGWACRKSAS